MFDGYCPHHISTVAHGAQPFSYLHRVCIVFQNHEKAMGKSTDDVPRPEGGAFLYIFHLAYVLPVVLFSLKYVYRSKDNMSVGPFFPHSNKVCRKSEHYLSQTSGILNGKISSLFSCSYL